MYKWFCKISHSLNFSLPMMEKKSVGIHGEKQWGVHSFSICKVGRNIGGGGGGGTLSDLPTYPHFAGNTWILQGSPAHPC